MKVHEGQGIVYKLIFRFQCQAFQRKGQGLFRGVFKFTKPQGVVVGVQMAQHGPGQSISRFDFNCLFNCGQGFLESIRGQDRFVVVET